MICSQIGHNESRHILTYELVAIEFVFNFISMFSYNMLMTQYIYLHLGMKKEVVLYAYFLSKISHQLANMWTNYIFCAHIQFPHECSKRGNTICNLDQCFYQPKL